MDNYYVLPNDGITHFLIWTMFICIVLMIILRFLEMFWNITQGKAMNVYYRRRIDELEIRIEETDIRIKSLEYKIRK